MTPREPIETTAFDRRRWWMFWRWSMPPYRGRRDRLSSEAQGQAANYNMRAGH